MDETQLRQFIIEIKALIAKISQLTPGSDEWESATKRLRRLRGLLYGEIRGLFEKSSLGIPRELYPDYEDLLVDTLLEALDDICNFDPPPEPHSIKKGLKNWINYKLRLEHEVKNLCSAAFPKIPKFKSPKREYNFLRRMRPFSLDSPLGNESNETFVDFLPDPQTLGDLDEWAEKWKREEVACKLRAYIEQDPEGKLQKCCLRKYPHCNAQVVARLLLSSSTYYKPNGINRKKIVEEKFPDVPRSSFCEFWEKCVRLLTEIARSFDYKNGEKL